jgi:pilus assembly protein CpaC
VLSILAEPNLTALSGETASFLAGGEFPIPVPQEDGKVTIEFKDFGVQLAFTPVVLDRGRISLHVGPEVSELTTTGAVSINGFVIPALTTRRAETTVELGSGQSFAIAGLLKNNVDHDVSKFPGLGDLPVLGSLFRSDSFRNDETELVIIVTPYLVRPVSDPGMAVPTDGLNPPNDAERIFLGQIDGEPSTADQGNAETGMDDQQLAGSVGFMLD